MKNLWFIILAIILQMIFITSFVTPDVNAAESKLFFWSKGGRSPSSYHAGTENTVHHLDDSFFIKSKSDQQSNRVNGTYKNLFDTKNLRGKKIKIVAQVKATSSNKKERSAYFFVQVKNQIEKYKWVNDEEDWHKVSLILNLPKDASTIVYGLSLWGSGKISLADIEIRALEQIVALP